MSPLKTTATLPDDPLSLPAGNTVVLVILAGITPHAAEAGLKEYILLILADASSFHHTPEARKLGERQQHRL